MSYLDGGADPMGQAEFEYYDDKIRDLLHKVSKEKYPNVFKFFDEDIEEDYFYASICFCSDYLFDSYTEVFEHVEEDCKAIGLDTFKTQEICNLFYDVGHIITDEIEAEREAEIEAERDDEEYQNFLREIRNSRKYTEEQKMFFGC